MAEAENLYLYLVGTAGAGKSRMTAAMKQWMIEHHLDAITVNLDPGAEDLPYEPDVDVRDWIRLPDVMAQYQLGPNGAQVVAADLLALQSHDLVEAIESFRTDLVLLDTPGQTELFVFREAGRHLVERLAPGRTGLAFLVDPHLARDPTSFVTQMMLGATTQFRFQVPMINVLTKVDLMPPGQLAMIQEWMGDTDTLHQALAKSEQSMHRFLNEQMLRVLEELGTYSQLTPISSETLEGLDDVLVWLEQAFAASEDLTTR